MTISADEVTRRFADADGKLFVTLDSPQIKKVRALNEHLFERCKDDPGTRPSLFASSPEENRRSVKIGDGILGEWWTKIHLNGKNVQIGKDVNLLGHGGIEIEENVKIGDRVSIDTIGHPNNPTQRNTAFTGGPVILKEGAHIGSGVVIIAPRGKSLTIGRNSRIADNSVLKSDVPDGASMAGVLAKMTKEPIQCHFDAPIESMTSFETIDSRERAQEIFGKGADVKFPIYVKGGHHISVRGEGRLGINKRAIFDLEGPLDIVPPYKMATDAVIKVEDKGSLKVEKEVFLYMNSKIIARGSVTIGSNSILGAGAFVDQSIESNKIMGGNNRVISEVDKDPLDPSVMPDWNDPASLPPKVEAFKQYKSSFDKLTNGQVLDEAIKADKELSSFKTK